MLTVVVAVADDQRAARVEDVLAAVPGVRVAGRHEPPGRWLPADLAVVDSDVVAPYPRLYCGPGPCPAGAVPMPEGARPDVLRPLLEAAVAVETTGAPRAGRTLAFWSAKGGEGVTTLALNVAAAAVEHGLRVVYVDADERYGDGACWFGYGEETADERGARPLTHPCGLRGVVARPDTPVGELVKSASAGFDVTVVDLPSALPPAEVAADVFTLVVGCEFPALRRARGVIEGLVPVGAELNVAARTRRGAELTVEDVDTVLGVSAAAVLEDEPGLTAWGDRGAFAYGLKRSRWAREVRAYATILCADLVPEEGGPTTPDDPAGADSIGQLAQRLRGRL